jgi:hypothetical protein
MIEEESMSESTTTVSQNGTHPAYHVEVRSIRGVKTMMGKHYGTEWTRFTPEQSCIPPSALYRLDRYFGLMTYEEAMAVAWMVKAYSESFTELSAYGIEARIVQSCVVYSYEAKRSKEFEPLEHYREPSKAAPTKPHD